LVRICGAAALGHDPRRDLFNDVKNFDQQLIVARFERKQGIDVTFGDDDNVYRPATGACDGTRARCRSRSLAVLIRD
jgi:hypothetical protein